MADYAIISYSDEIVQKLLFQKGIKYTFDKKFANCLAYYDNDSVSSPRVENIPFNYYLDVHKIAIITDFNVFNIRYIQTRYCKRNRITLLRFNDITYELAEKILMCFIKRQNMDRKILTFLHQTFYNENTDYKNNRELYKELLDVCFVPEEMSVKFGICMC